MTITSDSFLLPMGGGDSFEPFEDWYLDTERLTRIVTGPEPATADVDLAVALLDLVRDDLHKSGTGRAPVTTDSGMRLAIRALQRSSGRAGREVTLPFHDHTSWKNFWIGRGAANNYAARRALLSELLDEHHAALLRMQDQSLDATLVEAVSARALLGWPEVDTEVSALRRLFRAATTPQDCAAVGLLGVRLTEALSRKVYDHAVHTPPGEPEPKGTDTKKRLDRYVADRLPGPANDGLRRYVRATIELAQAVKHRGSPTRMEAGIAADAVIVLANILRRLDEDNNLTT